MKQLEFIPTKYPSDLTDAEWKIIEPFFHVGNKSAWHKRTLVNAVLYIKDNGCRWKDLPRDYPSYNTVWTFFRRTRDSGLWDRIMEVLVEATRMQAGRNYSPTYGVIDSQSAKTVGDTEDSGIDGGKKGQGSKTPHSG